MWRAIVIALGLAVACSPAEAAFNEPNAGMRGTSAAIGGASLAAGACATSTVSIAGVTTAMAIEITPQTYPGAGFFWRGYVSATGTVTVTICAAVLGTPTASTYNVRVIP